MAFSSYDELNSTFSDNDDGPGGSAAYYVSELAPAFKAELAEHGFIPRDTGIEYTPEALDWAYAQAEAIMREYDSEDKDRPLWLKYNLGGDDDVDYNGSYVIMIVEAIRVLTEETNQ